MKPSPVVPAICAASVASLLSISAYMNTQLPRTISGKPVPAAAASQPGAHAPGTRTTGTRTRTTGAKTGTGQHRTPPPAKPPANPGTGSSTGTGYGTGNGGTNGGGYGG